MRAKGKLQARAKARQEEEEIIISLTVNGDVGFNCGNDDKKCFGC